MSATHTLIQKALKYAVYPALLISANPAAYVEIPKNSPRNVVKRTIITPEQFAALLEKYPFGTPMYIPLLLLYHTGMRLGEVLGLLWQDIDFDAKKITLRQQIVYINKHGYFFTTLKTESSNRYVLIYDFLLDELKRWKNQQSENERHFGDTYVCIYRESNGHIVRQPVAVFVPNAEKVSLVCARSDGRLIIRNVIVAALRNEGLNAHSFRHTHATQLIENGAAPKGVAGRLGHANPSITQNLYAHNTQKLQEDTVTIFDKILQTRH